MTKEVVCDWNSFSLGIEQLIGDLPMDVQQRCGVVCAKTGRKGAKKLREEAGQKWTGKTGSRYASGFTSHADKSGNVVSSEIGNRNVPGLVHLLEKGHLTLAGRRVAGNPHVAPVFDELSPEFYDDIADAVGRALES